VRDGTQQGRRDVEHGIAPFLARDPEDHLAGTHDFAGLSADLGDDAGRVGPELCIVKAVLGDLLLGLRRLDLRLRAEVGLLRLVKLARVVKPFLSSASWRSKALRVWVSTASADAS
jgi:hypothetical protein